MVVPTSPLAKPPARALRARRQPILWHPPLDVLPLGSCIVPLDGSLLPLGIRPGVRGGHRASPARPQPLYSGGAGVTGQHRGLSLSQLIDGYGQSLTKISVLVLPTL